MLQALCFPSKYVTSFTDDRCQRREVSEILSKRFDSDAHYVAYVADAERRMKNILLGDEEAARGANVRMVLFIADVDAPDHTYGTSDAWRIEQVTRVDALLAAHPGAFVYDTRGGYRIVYGLPSPRSIHTESDAASWEAFYKSSCRYLARRFDIIADVKCADWTRLYRAPHVVRDGVAQELPTRGNPSALGSWALALEKADIVRAKPVAKTHGAVEPVPISDPENEYGQSRLSSAITYLESAPLGIEGSGGRDVFFKVCCFLMRRLRLPLDLAIDCVDVIYNPRLLAAGTTTWDRDDIEDRLISARDTSSKVPPGLVLDEQTWTEILGKLKAS